MESKDINEFTDCEYYNVSCGGICDQATVYGNTSTSITKCSNIVDCFIKNLYKQLQDKKQQYEELRQFHNSCCEEFKQEVNLRIDAYNKLSRDFFNSKYCNTEHCKLLQEKQQQCEKLKFELEHTHPSPRDDAHLRTALNNIQHVVTQLSFYVPDVYRSYCWHICNTIKDIKGE